jgi:hypothetical protein
VTPVQSGLSSSSGLPNCLQFSAGPGLLQEMQQQVNVLWIGEHLWDVLEAAIDCKVFVAHVIISWAVCEDVLDCLHPLTTLASYLIWGVLSIESLGIFADKGVSCGDTIECGDGLPGETGLSCRSCWSAGCEVSRHPSCSLCGHPEEGGVGFSVRWVGECCLVAQQCVWGLVPPHHPGIDRLSLGVTFLFHNGLGFVDQPEVHSVDGLQGKLPGSPATNKVACTGEPQ